jgi:5-(carboxyamino)imidazole ribonucleotide mutase
MPSPRIAVVMGSSSDYTTVEATIHLLDQFQVPYEKQVLSAHRTPEDMVAFAKTAQDRGIQVIIAAAGGAAHLPGMIASLTELPVIGIPVKTSALDGLDSLLSIAQMPAGVPVLTVAIGTAGAKNAALGALKILALHDDALRQHLHDYRLSLAEQARTSVLP